MRGNQFIPVPDDQFLPIFDTVTVLPDVFMIEMGIGDDPGVGGDYDGGRGRHSLMIVEKSFKIDFDPTIILKISLVFVRQFVTMPTLDHWVCAFPVPNPVLSSSLHPSSPRKLIVIRSALIV